MQPAQAPWGYGDAAQQYRQPGDQSPFQVGEGMGGSAAIDALSPYFHDQVGSDESNFVAFTPGSVTRQQPQAQQSGQPVVLPTFSRGMGSGQQATQTLHHGARNALKGIF